jgi:hypothetical protein
LASNWATLPIECWGEPRALHHEATCHRIESRIAGATYGSASRNISGSIYGDLNGDGPMIPPAPIVRIGWATADPSGGGAYETRPCSCTKDRRGAPPRSGRCRRHSWSTNECRCRSLGPDGSIFYRCRQCSLRGSGRAARRNVRIRCRNRIVPRCNPANVLSLAFIACAADRSTNSI